MIPLFKPYIPDLPEAEEILKSGNLAFGKYNILFENKLKEFFNNPYILAVNSYSSAIDVLLATLNIKNGDEIIMSPMCCLASTQPYVSKGIKIIWADIDSKTGTLLPNSVEEKITPKTKLIVHNHFCGFPGYVDEINAIGRKNNIIVIDDGIECFGSKYKGRLIGDCGTDVTVFSLSAVRIPNTIEGGILIFNNKAFYDKAILISDLGIDRARFRDNLGEISLNYDVSCIGYAAKMSNFNAYIGYESLKQIDKILKTQNENASKWDSVIGDAFRKVKIIDNCTPNYWVYGLLAPHKIEVIEFFRNKGFYASSVHIDNSRYSVFGETEPCLPGVKEFMDSFVAIPCGWWIDKDSIKI